MASRASAAPAEIHEYNIWSVILASAVGTMIEWYDFYIFGSLATVLAPKFYPPGNDTFALHRLPGHLRGRLHGPPLRRAVLRAHRRHGRPQICLSRHPEDHGRRHRPDRPAAHLCDSRLVRARHPDRHPRSARPGARAANTAARPSTWPNTSPIASAASTPASFRSPPRWASSSPCIVILVTQQSMTKDAFQGLGLAHPVPDLHRSGDHLPLHPDADEGIAHLHADQERRHDLCRSR